MAKVGLLLTQKFLKTGHNESKSKFTGVKSHTNPSLFQDNDVTHQLLSSAKRSSSGKWDIPINCDLTGQTAAK